MKNFLLVLLAAGLAVSLYFNWRHCSSGGGSETSGKTLNLSDSAEIKFTYVGEKTVKDTLPPKSGQDTTTVVIKTGSGGVESGTMAVFKPSCCPTYPDTTAARVYNSMDPARIVAVQIRSLGVAKKP